MSQSPDIPAASSLQPLPPPLPVPPTSVLPAPSPATGPSAVLSASPSLHRPSPLRACSCPSPLLLSGTKGASIGTHLDTLCNLHAGGRPPCLATRAAFPATARLFWSCAVRPVASLLLLLLLPLLLLLLQLRRKGREQLGLRKVPHALLALCLVTTHCLASPSRPWVQETAGSVKLRARYCRPVPDDHLRTMLGAAFDPDRMAGDDPRAGPLKRGADLHLDPDLEVEDAAFDSYYDPDDPGSSYGNEDFVDMVEQDGFRAGGEEWLGKGTAGEGEKGEQGKYFYNKKDTSWDGFSKSRRPDSDARVKDKPRPDHQAYLYMRRRRREAAYHRHARDAASPDSFNTKDRDTSLLPLRLFLSGRNRKLRRKLKKALRKKTRKTAQNPPPWACGMSKAWGRLKEGYFPRYLLDGRCVTDKCFYRLYDCVPQKYRVKMLKRDPDYCNPLPALGANSTYEQKWTVVRYYVTVGCNCQAADPLQRSTSARRNRY